MSHPTIIDREQTLRETQADLDDLAQVVDRMQAAIAEIERQMAALRQAVLYRAPTGED